MASLHSVQHPDFLDRPGEAFDAAYLRQTAVLDKLTRQSNDLPADQVVGGIVQFPVADGYAIYLVTKDKPLTLQHLAYGDGYHADPALIRGLRRQDILTGSIELGGLLHS